MFPSSGSSDFDLRFNLFGIPVQVTPMFWLMAVILGLPYLQEAGPLALITWVGVVFISILVHELGHALAARSVGHSPAIQLTYFGGLAYFQQFRLTPWRLVYISAAGPAAGYALYLLCYNLAIYGYIPVSMTVQQLVTVNFYWTIFNLLPVYPLDGGQILLGLTQALLPRFSPQITHGLGAIVAAIIAIFAFRSGDIFLVVMFAMFAMLNIQMLQSRRMW